MIPKDIAEQLAGDMGWDFAPDHHSNGLHEYIFDNGEAAFKPPHVDWWKLNYAGAFDVLVKMGWSLEHDGMWTCWAKVQVGPNGFNHNSSPIRAIEKAVIAYYGEKG